MAATPTQPEQTTTTATTQPVEVAAPPELDVVSLLLPDAAKDEQAKEPADTSATDGAAAEGADEAEAPAEAETAEVKDEPKPGTPDKALQKLQQDQAAALRKIEELSQRIEAGEKPTEADKAQLQQQKRKLDAVREGLKAKGAEFDLLEHDAAVAESLLEHDDKLTSTEQKLAAAEARLAKLEARTAKDETAELWAGHKALYPGVAVEGVWEKAFNDAAELMGVDPATADASVGEALNRAASRIFHNRAAAARDSKAAKQGEPAPAKTKTTNRVAADPTPNGGRVTGSNAHPPTGQVSEDTAYVAMAMNLVKK